MSAIRCRIKKVSIDSYEKISKFFMMIVVVVLVVVVVKVCLFSGVAIILLEWPWPVVKEWLMNMVVNLLGSLGWLL